MGFLVGKKKLLFGLVGFFAPFLTAGLTGEVSWKEAARLATVAAVAYCASEGVADAGRGIATRDVELTETIARPRVPRRRQPATPREPV